MELIGEIIVSVLLVVGGFFGFVGSYGLVKLPDQMTRLHAPTKSATLGVGAVLIASLVWFPLEHGQLTWHELLITLFLFLTAPVTGNIVAKANLHMNWHPDDIPAPEPGKTWSTFGDPAHENLPRQ
ncbi:Na+/H+ antiporter subunit G [Paracoccus sp. MBLB3053]|uniref:Na+/H+ antiporter subunit G n=1 Tax=Paracoccus aurantius TaxID=3073814 RepID=A0ABU2HP04_9RHOB|nr:Na+/H+ antiporter subunit G [Paracoccus sp. MBLB3053]MDS9466472.1 Na+/H+ antiporter subunit G [Paracoccus sp. MBLB3053]